MRLREIYTICIEEFDSWHEPLFVEGRNPNGATFYRLSNSTEIRDRLNKLKRIHCLEATIKDIENTTVNFYIKGADLCWDGAGRNKFISLYTSLKEKTGIICSLYESFGFEDNNDGIDVKLPPDMTLEELSKCAHDLNIAFSGCPLLSKQSGNISLSSIDVGSMWLNFVVIGASATAILTAIAALVDKVVHIKSHFLSMKQQEEQLRSMGCANDLLEQMQVMHEKFGKEILEKASRDLAIEHDINDPEECSRVQNSLKLLSDWMSKGMEVYASVQAQPEIKVLFPPVEQQKLSFKEVGLLTDPNVTTEENKK